MNEARGSYGGPKMQIRQGDVFLAAVDEIPEGRRLSFAAQPGRLVLAYGEATGHHHSVAERDAEMVETEAGEYQPATET